jgi:hypothetical protein
MKYVTKRVPRCNHPGCRKEAAYMNIICQRGKKAVYDPRCAEHQR